MRWWWLKQESLGMLAAAAAALRLPVPVHQLPLLLPLPHPPLPPPTTPPAAFLTLYANGKSAVRVDAPGVRQMGPHFFSGNPSPR